MSLFIFMSELLSHSRPPNNYTLFLQLKSTLRGPNIPVLKAKTLGNDELGAAGHSQGKAWAPLRLCLGMLCPCSLESVRKALHFRSQKILKPQFKLAEVPVAHSAAGKWLLPGLQGSGDVGTPGFFWFSPHGCTVAATEPSTSSSSCIQRQGRGLTSKNVSR